MATFPSPCLIPVILLIVFLVVRNQKEEKEFEEDIRREGLTSKDGGDFIESDERMQLVCGNTQKKI